MSWSTLRYLSLIPQFSTKPFVSCLFTCLTLSVSVFVCCVCVFTPFFPRSYSVSHRCSGLFLFVRAQLLRALPRIVALWHPGYLLHSAQFVCCLKIQYLSGELPLFTPGSAVLAAASSAPPTSRHYVLQHFFTIFFGVLHLGPKKRKENLNLTTTLSLQSWSVQTFAERWRLKHLASIFLQHHNVTQGRDSTIIFVYYILLWWH